MAQSNFDADVALIAWAAASDLVLAFLPLGLFLPLQLPARVRIGLSILMGLGVIAAVSTILRTMQLPAMKSSDGSCEYSKLLCLLSFSSQY